MTRTLSWVVVSAWIACALPAFADVPNDDCGTKNVGDRCEDFTGETGLCVEDSDDQLSCDTSAPEPEDGGAGSQGGDGDGDQDDDEGCSVGSVGLGSGGEAAALGMLLLVCIALRKRVR